MLNERVVIDPAVRHGKPVIRGTRVPIHRIVGLATGASPEEICKEYDISDEDLRAALAYAQEPVGAVHAQGETRAPCTRQLTSRGGR